MTRFNLAASQQHESLTIFPVIDPDGGDLPFTLMAEALEQGLLTVEEVGSGSVPELAVENSGDTFVLILDGEQLIGAKQNRMTNRTILLAAHTKTRIPVSCMEHGRWQFESRTFRHQYHHSPSAVRRHARKTEAKYAAMDMEVAPQALASVQGEVWDEIATVSARMGLRSDTGAMDHLYNEKMVDIEEWSKSFPWVDDQIGILAFLGEMPLGIDVIGGYKLYASLHKRLVGGYIMDAFASRRKENVEIDKEIGDHFSERIAEATRTDAPTVGEGTYRVLSGDVMGAELEHEERLVHLSAFPMDEAYRRDEVSDGPPIAPPSRRRRWRH